MTSFADLGTSRSVVDALAARSIDHPFPVQEMVIRDALAGHDLLVQSPTGSGKTLAFGIPLVDLIGPRERGPQALVLAPTRELAGQIVDELDSLARARRLRIAAVYGGVGFGPQLKAAGRADILVATPGRLEDLIGRGAVSLGRVRVLILDEADRMLDMGFRPAVDRIVAGTPRDRQTLFFSATLEGAAGRVAGSYTRDARSHTQAAPERDEPAIEHRFVKVDSQDAKLEHLVAQLSGKDVGRSLVFVRTKRGADRLVKRLHDHRVPAVAMHGNKSQRQREDALSRFERGKVLTLVATDVAARGIDVPEVAQVINYDAPEDREAYVHRVGRTGRAGRTGTGISFVLAEQTEEMRRIGASLGLAHGLGGPDRTGPSGPARRRRNRRRRPRTMAQLVGAHAVRWSCARCEVSVGRLDGASTELPPTWTSSGDSTFCLTCSRALAGEAAMDSAPPTCSREELFLLRREAVIRFEIDRTPLAPNRTIALACRTSPRKVASVRDALDAAPPPQLSTASGGS